jgi:Family of unknown function (DUF6399)
VHEQPAQDQTEPQAPPVAKRRSRGEVVGKVVDFEKARFRAISQRQYAREQGIARTTLQRWLTSKEKLEAAPELVAFFESPAGVALLHRMQVAGHLVMSMMGACGIGLVCLFFRYAGLAPFLALSHGAQQGVARKMEEQIVQFGQQEKVRLSAQMAPKEIAVCEDETFHKDPCLVAIEPLSDFILVEQYSSKRDAPSWDQALKSALKDMPVHVNQVASDEAQGIKRHVQAGLGVHHDPDVFHVQYEVSRGTAAPLSAQLRGAQAQLDEASQKLQHVLQQEQTYASQPRGPGRPPDFVARIEAAQHQVALCQQQVQSASDNKKAMQQAVRDIGIHYHPFDLETGGKKTPEEVKTELDAVFDNARSIAHRAHLPARCLDRINKAARVAPAMVATIAFFHALVATKVTALGLPAPLLAWVHKVLIPALYLKRVARTAKDTATRAAREQVATTLLQTLRAAPAAWTALPQATQEAIWAVAHQCAELFIRSSSCVEGRNGQLALRHHHLHRISARRLCALTVIHNYVLRRPDGTTAAQRFFGTPGADLFTLLCDRLPLPARPRKSASRRARPLPVQAA